jgi:hypothetical protein
MNREELDVLLLPYGYHGPELLTRMRRVNALLTCLYIIFTSVIFVLFVIVSQSPHLENSVDWNYYLYRLLPIAISPFLLLLLIGVLSRLFCGRLIRQELRLSALPKNSVYFMQDAEVDFGSLIQSIAERQDFLDICVQLYRSDLRFSNNKLTHRKILERGLEKLVHRRLTIDLTDEQLVYLRAVLRTFHPAYGKDLYILMMRALPFLRHPDMSYTVNRFLKYWLRGKFKAEVLGTSVQSGIL